MILADIKQYLSQRGSTNLSDISVHFDTDPDAMRGMLEQWVRKGRISKYITNELCGSSCSKCKAKDSEIYQWVDAENNTFMGIGIRPEGNGK